jgi:hypothetical protein
MKTSSLKCHLSVYYSLEMYHNNQRPRLNDQLLGKVYVLKFFIQNILLILKCINKLEYLYTRASTSNMVTCIGVVFIARALCAALIPEVPFATF